MGSSIDHQPFIDPPEEEAMFLATTDLRARPLPFVTNALKMLASVVVMSWMPASFADDGMTYRIGEVNPYDGTAWYRYYRVQSGGRTDREYAIIRAKAMQSIDDAKYLDRLRSQREQALRQYRQGYDRYKESKGDYVELRDLYAQALKSPTLDSLRENLEAAGLLDLLDRIKAVYDSDGNRDDSLVDQAERDLAKRLESLNDQATRLSRFGEEIRTFQRNANDYASRHNRDARQIVSQISAYEREMDRRSGPPEALSSGSWGEHAR
jgi:hypothetical protein